MAWGTGRGRARRHSATPSAAAVRPPRVVARVGPRTGQSHSQPGAGQPASPRAVWCSEDLDGAATTPRRLAPGGGGASPGSDRCISPPPSSPAVASSAPCAGAERVPAPFPPLKPKTTFNTKIKNPALRLAFLCPVSSPRPDGLGFDSGHREPCSQPRSSPYQP